MNRLIICSCLLVGVTAPTFAQFQLDIHQLAAVSYEPEEVEVPKHQNNQQVAFGFQQNIDAWIFNRHQSATKARKFLSNQLKAKVAAVKESTDVSEDQLRRLSLAGTGDIARFFAKVNVIRDEFKNQPQNGFNNQLFQKVQPLQQQMQKGLFGSDSMFAMVTKHTLDEEQRERFVQAERIRIQAVYFDSIKLTVSELEKSTPMTSDQRESLVKLLEDSKPPSGAGQYMYYFVLYQLSQKKNEVNKIFIKRGQRSSIQQALNQGRAMEQFLRQNGFLEQAM